MVKNYCAIRSCTRHRVSAYRKIDTNRESNFSFIRICCKQYYRLINHLFQEVVVASLLMEWRREDPCGHWKKLAFKITQILCLYQVGRLGKDLNTTGTKSILKQKGIIVSSSLHFLFFLQLRTQPITQQ
jgi:hypothetical protein